MNARIAQTGVVVAFLLGTACTAVLGVKDITGSTGPEGDEGSSGGGSSSGTGGGSTSSGSGSGGTGSSGTGSSGAASGGRGSSGGGSSSGSGAADAGGDAGSYAAAWVGTWVLSGTWAITDCTNSSADESMPAPTVTWAIGGSGLTGTSSNGCQFDATAANGFLSLTSTSPPCTLMSNGRTDVITFGKWFWYTTIGGDAGGLTTFGADGGATTPPAGDAAGGIATDEYPDGTDNVTLPGGATTTCKISISDTATRE
jgi:hypothetical protein